MLTKVGKKKIILLIIELFIFTKKIFLGFLRETMRRFLPILIPCLSIYVCTYVCMYLFIRDHPSNDLISKCLEQVDLSQPETRIQEPIWVSPGVSGTQALCLLCFRASISIKLNEELRCE